MNQILILTSGNVSKLEAFKNEPVDLASFNDIWYDSLDANLKLQTSNLKQYQLIYFRMVGRSLEVATLVADFAIQNRIKLVDKIYESSHLLPLSLGKSLEIRKLIEAGLPVPRTVFNRFDALRYPFVLKSTTSSRGREVWLINNDEEMNDKRSTMDKEKFYFIQEFIPESHRIRALVVGEKVVGAVKRQTKWHKDETEETLNPVPENVEKLAVSAARAVGLDICGVDILVNPTGQMWVIEANAAPSWKLIAQNCGVNVEHEIVKYLQSQI